MSASRKYDTAMGRAFAAKGREAGGERLRRLIRETLESKNGRWEATFGAVMDAVSRDLDLLWALTEKYRNAALAEWIKREQGEVALERAREFRNTGADRNAKSIAQAPPSSAGGDQWMCESQKNPVPASAPIPPKPTPADRMKAKLEAVALVCPLHTFMVGFKPIGQCTVWEAREWAMKARDRVRANATDYRFVMSLTSGMLESSMAGEMLIGDFWKGKESEVSAVFEKARHEYEEWSA